MEAFLQLLERGWKTRHLILELEKRKSALMFFLAETKNYPAQISPTAIVQPTTMVYKQRLNNTIDFFMKDTAFNLALEPNGPLIK